MLWTRRKMMKKSVFVYLLYQEKSLGMLAFTFFKWSNCNNTSSNFSMPLQIHKIAKKPKNQFLFFLINFFKIFSNLKYSTKVWSFHPNGRPINSGSNNYIYIFKAKHKKWQEKERERERERNKRNKGVRKTCRVS